MEKFVLVRKWVQDAADYIIHDDDDGEDDDGEGTASITHPVEERIGWMKKFFKDAGVQERGCEVLRRIAVDSSDIQDTIVACGGIEAIESAMKNHPHNAAVCRPASEVLNEFARRRD